MLSANPLSLAILALALSPTATALEMHWPDSDSLDLSSPITIGWTNDNVRSGGPINDETEINISFFYRLDGGGDTFAYSVDQNITLGEGDGEYVWDPEDFVAERSDEGDTLAGGEEHKFQVWVRRPNGTRGPSMFEDSERYSVEGYDDVGSWGSVSRPGPAWGAVSVSAAVAVAGGVLGTALF